MADVPAIRITAINDASKVIDQVTKSLAGLASSIISINAVMQTFRSAMDFGDQLQTTNEKLGISITKLQELSAIAVQSNTSLEAFGKSFKFLAESMIKAQNASSEQGKLFKALGINIRDSAGNLRAFEDVAPEVAGALNKVGNETVRVAAGVAIFGKGYLEVAAALRTYKQAQEEANKVIAIFGTVTVTAAQAADQLGDKMKLVGEGFKATTLNEMSRGFASLAVSIDGNLSVIQKFSQFIGHGFAVDMRDAAIIVTKFQQAWEILAMIVSRTWKSIRERSKEGIAQIAKDRQEIFKKYEAERGAIRSSFAFPGLDNEDQISPKAGGADRLKQAQIDAKAVAAALGGSKDAVDKITSALEAMVKSQDAALASQLKLTEVDKLYIALSAMKLGTLKGENLELVKRLTVGAQLADKLREEADALKLVTEAAEANAKAWVALADEVFKQADAANMQVVAATDLVAQMEDELRLMQLSDIEREREVALRKLQATGIDQTSDAYKGLLARMDEAVAAKGAMQQQIDLWGKIDDAAHDAFTHIFEGGKSVLDRIIGSIKQIGLELAYLAAKRWVINLAIGGGAAGAAGGAAGSPLGGLLGGGGFLSGLADSSGLTAGMGNAALGLGFSGSMATMIAANAIPIVGTVLAVGGGLIYNWLKSKEGGPKTGGQGISGTAGMLGGYTDASGRWITPADADAQMKQYTDATLKSYQEFAKAFGIKAVVGFAQGFTSDPQGTAGNILHTQAFINGKSVYEVALGDLGRDAQQLADRIALENKRALIAALKGSDLPGVLSKLFSTLTPETTSGAVADSLLVFAGAYKNLYDVFDANPLDDALEAVAVAAGGAQAAVEKQAEALLDLLRIYDGTGESTVALAEATRGYYGNVVTLIAQMEQLKTTIADMFAGTIKQFTFAKLDAGGQFKFLQAGIADAFAKLQGSTSATEIERLSRLIDTDMREMFGLLSPKEQAQQADKFIENANRINETAQAQIAKAAKAEEERLTAILTRIQGAIDQAAANLSGSADDLSNAADDLSGAVGSQQPATVNG